MKKVIIASKNPVKINSAKEAFEKMFPDEQFEVRGVSASSGVSDQPMSDEETYRGAENRARNVRTLEPRADYWVGMEGGIEAHGQEIEAFAWMCVLSQDDVMGKGRTSTFFLPPKMVVLIQEGNEMGYAADVVFEEHNSNQNQGSVGLLTHGLVDRTTYYVQPMIMALIPFANSELYADR